MGKLFFTLFMLMMAYFSLKSLLFPPRRPASKPGQPRREGTDFQGEGEMVQDPVCGTYVEKESALSVSREGRTIWFCSETCREKYLAGGRQPEG